MQEETILLPARSLANVASPWLEFLLASADAVDPIWIVKFLYLNHKYRKKFADGRSGPRVKRVEARAYTRGWSNAGVAAGQQPRSLLLRNDYLSRTPRLPIDGWPCIRRNTRKPHIRLCTHEETDVSDTQFGVSYHKLFRRLHIALHHQQGGLEILFLGGRRALVIRRD